MEQARAYLSGNRSTVMNIVYVVAFMVALYYLYKFFIASSDLDVDVLNAEADANMPQSFPLPDDARIRVKTGGEYTLSFWMYISSWDYRAGLAKSVLQIVDSASPSNALLNTILYPNESKMMIRVRTESAAGGETDYTNFNNFNALLSGGQRGGMYGPTMESPMCDLVDIELQRWINITVSVNGRIVDVYYDGKLARSCVLPSIPVAPTNGRQAIAIGQKGGYGGKISGIQFFAYPLTPDRIYSIYQGGPRGAAGFIGYIADKLGIRINYSGAGGAAKGVTF
jgi:hypothetical protein